MKLNFCVTLVLFVVAVISSARLSIAWPYIENWPYTGLLYSVLFLLFSVIAGVKLQNHFIKPKSNISWLKVAVSFLLQFLVCSAFWSFSLRFLTEPQIAYAFEGATIVEKYRSSNHNYPGLCLRYEDGKTIRIDIPGQEELWQQVQIGFVVRKEFGKQEIFLLSHNE